MKILMLGWELPPHNSGGLGVACYQLSRALAARGASIDFVVPYRAHHPETEFMQVHAATPLEPTYRLDMGAYTTRIDGDQPAGGGLRQLQAEYGRYVTQQAARLAPDVIHAHDWLTFEAGIAARQATGAPLVAHVHATEFDRSGANAGNPLIHEIEYTGLMMADRIVAVSEATRQLITERYHIPAEKIEVVHNSIDPETLLGATATTESEDYRYVRTLQQEGAVVVSTVGRLTVQKGLTHFLRAGAMASRKVGNLLFIIGGDGEQRDELISLSAELGIADIVLFTGYIRGQRWREVYQLSDVFVMSSLSEPFGLTVLEAAAHATPAIVTRQSGVTEVLANVLKYDYWDEARLSDLLVNLAASTSLRRELAANAGRELSRLSWQDAASRCLEHYQHASRARMEERVAA